MAALMCDICGGKLTMGAGGIATCESCGMEHSQDRVKEKVQEIKGTVKVDNSHMVNNYLTMAQNGITTQNYEEAENYANKIIEIDSQVYEAWNIKAKASGWQTTGRNNRYPESIVAWVNAYNYAPEEAKEELKEEITKEASKIGLAILQMEFNSYRGHQSEQNYKDILNALEMLRKQLNELTYKTKGKIKRIYDDLFKHVLANMLNEEVVKVNKIANEKFGPENSDRTKYAWHQYTATLDQCLKLLEKAYNFTESEESRFTICKNYIAIAETVKESCSYKFVTRNYSSSYIKDYSFTESAKEYRQKDIDEWEKKRDFYDPEVKKNNLNLIMYDWKKVSKELQELAGFAQYWEQHASEKVNLENEKKQLEEQAKHIKEENASNPIYADEKRLEDNISKLKSEQKALGLFKGKEKKEKQAQIDKVTVELNDVMKLVKDAKQQYESQLNPVESRIEEIETELTKTRGSAQLSHNSMIEIIGTDKKIKMSPLELVHYFATCMPKPYGVKCDGAEAIINESKASHDSKQEMNKMLKNGEMQQMLGSKTKTMQQLFGLTGEQEEWVDDPNKTKEYKIPFYNDEEETKGAIYCQATSIDSPISRISKIELDSQFSVEDASTFTIIVSKLLFDMLPSSNIDEIQKFIANHIYGTINSEDDGIRLDGIDVDVTHYSTNIDIQLYIRS